MQAAARVPRTLHDALARYVFGRPRAAAIVLRCVLPPRVLELLALETLRPLSPGTTRPSLGDRTADLVFAVELHEGGSGPIHVVLEHLSNPDPLLAWRALVYAGEQWGRYVAAGSPRPRMLPFILPVLIVQPPARGTPARLSEILAVPDHLRAALGSPFEVTLHVDDLSRSVLDDPVADAGYLALVEITRTLLYAYGNNDSLTTTRLAGLAPLFDTVLVHFGSAEVRELWTYVIGVFGAESPIHAIILRSYGKAVQEMYVTIADALRAEGLSRGRAEGLSRGRAAAKAEAVLGVLEHRGVPIPSVVRERVLATTDEALLERWFDRAFTATTSAQLFEI